MMNIDLAEPVITGTSSTCRSDNYYGSLPATQLKQLMSRRATEIPADDELGYCVSPLNVMYIGGKRPR